MLKLFVGISMVMLILQSCNTDVTELYVSPDGSDENKGTLKDPLKSLTGARDRIRELRKTYEKSSFIVFLREGEYYLNETAVFDERDSGTENNPVHYKSYRNERVKISGGKKLPADSFKPLEDEDVTRRILSKEAKRKIVQVNLKEIKITDYGEIKQHGFSVAILPAQMELFVDDEPQILAKWPNQGRVDIFGVVNEGSLPIEEDFSGKGGVITYDDPRHNKWQEPEKAWLWGFFKAGYADDNLGIEHIDTLRKEIKLKHAHMFGLAKTDRAHEWTGRNAGYFAYNILEEIDMPGEYYIDREKGMLYYYPIDKFDKSNAVVSYMEEPLLALEGVSNLVFEGITFECGKGMGIYIERGSNNQIRGCILRNFGTIAVMFGKGVSGADYPIHEFTGDLKSRTVGNLKAHHYANTQFFNDPGNNNGLISCNIYNTGSGGIVLSGGNRTTLEAGNNFVENCEFHHLNRRNKTYCAQVTLYGMGNRISHCYFHDAPHLAVAIFGNEHIIEYSRFEYLVQDIHDAGAIGMGRNPSERGNVIRFNYFADLGNKDFKNTALHLDDGSSLITVYGNIFYKCSKMDFGDVTMNGGSDNLVSNNIFIEGAHGIWLEDPVIAGTPFYQKQNGLDTGGIYWQRMKEDLDISSREWQAKYPEFADFFEWDSPFLLRNKVVNNVFYKTPYMISKHGFDSTKFEVWQNNWITDQDPGFINLSNKNFNLKKDALVYDKIPGFRTLSFDSIGLYEDSYRRQEFSEN